MAKDQESKRRDRKICVICKKEFTEFGNNPWPLKEEGQCCDHCDSTKVLVARLRLVGYQPGKAKEFGKWHYDNIKSGKFSGIINNRKKTNHEQ